MPRLAVDITAPAADVFAHIADARQRPAWLPELHAMDDVPDRALAAGDRFVGYAVAAGHRIVGTSEIVTADHAGRRLEEIVVIGARFRTSWTVTPRAGGEGCRVTQDIGFDFPQGAAGRLERWVLDRYAARMQREGLRRLAELAAASGGSGGPSGAAGGDNADGGGTATRTGSSPPQRLRWWLRRSARSSP